MLGVINPAFLLIESVFVKNITEKNIIC